MTQPWCNALCTLPGRGWFSRTARFSVAVAPQRDIGGAKVNPIGLPVCPQATGKGRVNNRAAILIAAFFFPAIAVTTAVLAGQLPPPPPGYAWQLNPQLSDEFNGICLDTNKWLPFFPGWKGRVPSRFETTNVCVRDGKLEIRSTLVVSNTASVKDPTNDIWIGAGCVSSRSPTASYGYYEARVKTSALSMSSSFWLQGRYSEIDVAEQLGASVEYPERRKYMLIHTHFFKNGWDHDVSEGVRWRMSSDAGSRYHVYGVWWRDEDTAWFYHNGQKVAEMQFGGKFQEPMSLYFDTEAIISAGLPSVESLKDRRKNAMSVDWVRAWSLVKTNNPHQK